MVAITDWFLVFIPGSAGHSMTLFYRDKKTRFAPDVPAAIANFSCEI